MDYWGRPSDVRETLRRHYAGPTSGLKPTALRFWIRVVARSAEKTDCLSASDGQHIAAAFAREGLIGVHVRLRLDTVMHDNLEDEVSSKEASHIEARKSFHDFVRPSPIKSDELQNRLVFGRHRRKSER